MFFFFYFKNSSLLCCAILIPACFFLLLRCYRFVIDSTARTVSYYDKTAIHCTSQQNRQPAAAVNLNIHIHIMVLSLACTRMLLLAHTPYHANQCTFFSTCCVDLVCCTSVYTRPLPTGTPTSIVNLSAEPYGTIMLADIVALEYQSSARTENITTFGGRTYKM